MDAEKRILQERSNWRKDRPFGFSANPEETPTGALDLFTWECIMPGPENTVFSDRKIRLKLLFPKSYPVQPPQAFLVSQIYHPNVYTDGYVCLDILAESWKASMNIKSILLAVHRLISTPNIQSPANEEAASLYSSNPEEYQKKARELFAE